MLKKLFISLIILSTLASEGILNIPVNICNILTYLNSESGQSKNTQALQEVAKDQKENRNLSAGGFKLTSGSVLKICLSNNGTFLSKIKMPFNRKSILDIKSVYLSNNLANEATVQTKKSNFFLKTDTSPPII